MQQGEGGRPRGVGGLNLRHWMRRGNCLTVKQGKAVVHRQAVKSVWIKGSAWRPEELNLVFGQNALSRLHNTSNVLTTQSNKRHEGNCMQL